MVQSNRSNLLYAVLLAAQLCVDTEGRRRSAVFRNLSLTVFPENKLI